MRRASWGRLLAVLVVVGAVLVTASAASAATLTACVNKRTGEMRLRQGKAAKKKCPKGWKKVRWSVQGPAGKQGQPGVNGTNGVNGSPGPNLVLKDASGNVVGQYLGMSLLEVPIYLVGRDGGIWLYYGSGNLIPNANPDYKASDCSGTAYQKVPSSFTTPAYAAILGGQYRLVFRTFSGGVFGPSPTAWQVTTASQTLSAVQLYRRNSSTGVCGTDGAPFTGDVLALQPVPAPPDFTGPPTIG